MAVKIYKTASSVNEGSTTTFYASGFGATDKTFTYTLSTAGTNIAGYLDVKGAASTSTGTVNISNGVAIIPLTLSADLTTEGNETLTLSYGANAVTNSAGVVTSIASTSTENAVITVYDTSTDSPSKIIPSAAMVNEGSTVTFNINAKDGIYPYAITGATVTDDYTVTTNTNVTSTTVKVVNGVGSISVVTKADAATEGLEDLILTLSVPTLVTSPPTVAPAAVTVRILDTSTAPTNVLTPSVASVNEGGGMTFNFVNATKGTYSAVLSSTGLAASEAKINNTALTVNGSGVQTNSISVTVGDNGLASIPVSFVNDLATEGAETFTLTLTGSSVTKTATVIVNDTSNAIPTLSPAATSVNEGGSAVFTLNNVVAGSYAYTLSGVTTTVPTGVTNAGLADIGTVAVSTSTASIAIATGLTGTITVLTGKTSATLTVPLLNDRVTEFGGEMLTMTMTAGGVIPVGGIDAAVLVNDSSKTYAYSLNPSTGAVNEGSSVVFSITDGKPGATVGYTVSGVTPATIFGTATAADFSLSQGLIQTTAVFPTGTTIIDGSGRATFTVFVAADAIKDGSANAVTQTEKFQVTLDEYVSSAHSPVITQVGTYIASINDTSVPA